MYFKRIPFATGVNIAVLLIHIPVIHPTVRYFDFIIYFFSTLLVATCFMLLVDALKAFADQC